MDDIHVAIDAYRPRGFAGTKDEQTRLALVVCGVGSVSWPSATQAAKAMTHVWAFATWLAEHERSVGPSSLTEECVDRYLASLRHRKQGSRDAIRSFLMRVVARPGDGSATVATPSSQPRAAGATAEMLIPPLEAEFDAYVSKGQRLSAAAVTFLRGVVRSVRPDTRRALRRLVRTTAPVVRMIDAQHRPLRVDVVFATTTIEEHLATLDSHASPKSVATYASTLYRAQEALLPEEQRGAGRRVPRGKQRPVEIDDAEATATQLRWARTRRNNATRRSCQALLALVRGAGADGAEAARVRLDEDIATDSDGNVVVTLTAHNGVRRPVPVALGWQPLFKACVQEALEAGDAWLIGGGPARRRNRASDLRAQANRCGVDLSLQRARDTWLVEQCIAHGLPDFLRMCGLVRPEALERVWCQVVVQAAER